MPRKVALIGTAFRLPSTTKASLWSDLLTGRDLVSTVSAERWAQESFLHSRKSSPGSSYTFQSGSIGDASLFDASFFGISPREAAQMDPQQRLLLELAWEAFEDAGIRPSTMRGSSCGVYIGIASADYSYRIAEDLSVIDSSVATGNTASIAANRLSYFYDLRGPSMALDTACSSSLVAFHQACQAIRSGEVSHALAGGVSLHLHPYGFIIFSKASMLSPLGRCNVFDADGDGYVRSEGGGIFVLKDFELARADGDRILAVVANTMINTDGHKSGLTIPSAEAQSSLLKRAYQAAGIAPDEISYIEAHGTGTAVGDPIETRAIGDSIGQQRRADNPLPIGSIKSNLGHLEAAAGVAGVVKALEIIKHRQIPATIGITQLNPRIDFEGLNLKVITQASALPREGQIIVGVNSFGFGGSNAHIILTSPDADSARGELAHRFDQFEGPNNDRWIPITLSAATPDALSAAATRLADALDHPSNSTLYNVAYELAFRREWFEHRAILFAPKASTCADAAQALRRLGLGEMPLDPTAAQQPQETEGICQVAAGVAIERAKGPAFFYAGNGAQWVGMGSRLLDNPVFSSAINAIDEIFYGLAGYRIRDHLAGTLDVAGYQHTNHAQPALFAVQVGMTEVLRTMGIHPLATAGHSVGEIAAAWAAGALTLADAVQVIFHRSRLQETTKGLGTMTAVALDAESAEALIHACGLAGRIHIAGYNSLKGLTLAGVEADLACFEASLSDERIGYKRLPLDYAFHSPAMDGIESQILTALSELQPGATRIPYYSGVTGEQIEGSLLTAAYWWHNIRYPVRFADAVSSAIADGFNGLMEISPHPVLKSYLADALNANACAGIALTTLTRDRDAEQDLAAAAGRVMVAMGGGDASGASSTHALPDVGVTHAGVDLSVYFPTIGKRADLPHYPWQKERHWLDHTAESPRTLERTPDHPLLGARLPHHEWTWERRIDPARVPFLADHVIGNAVVLPGTAYVEMALAVSRAWQAKLTNQVEDLDILSPMTFGSQQEKVLRVELDPADGRLTIKSRDVLSWEPWIVNARCRIIQDAKFPQPNGSAGRKDVSPPEGAIAFNGESHLELTRQVGLQYGAAFQAIESGWSTSDEVEATLSMPAIVREAADQYLVHPALLDCAFQLIIDMLRERIDLSLGIAFVPTQVGRASWSAGAYQPRTARARLLGWQPHSLLVDFTLFDSDGATILQIDHARFKRVRLHQAAGRSIQYLHTRLIPQPLNPAQSESVIEYEYTLRMLNDQAHLNSIDYTRKVYIDELDPLLDVLCGRFGIEALEQPTGDPESTVTAVVPMPDDSDLAIYYQYLVAQARLDGFLDPSANPPEIADSAEQAEQYCAIDIWNTLVSDYPDYAAIIRTVGRIGRQLPLLMSGALTRDSAVSLIPNLAEVVALIRGKSGTSRILAGVRASIVEAHGRMKSCDRLGILEVGALGPTIAADLATHLDPDRDDLVVAVGCVEDLRFAEELVRTHPWIGVDAIDNAMGEPATFQSDIAIVYLDFSSDAANYRAVDYALSHLKPSGSLLVIGHHPARWIDFVFGLSATWWGEQPLNVKESRQRSRAAWEARLAGLGLEGVSHMAASREAEAGPYLLMGKRPSRAGTMRPIASHETPRSWLLVADDAGSSSAHFADQLARSLQRVGGIANICSASDQIAIASQITEMISQFGDLDGIVHLRGLGGNETSCATDRCLVAGQIARACEATACAAPIWIVTSGVYPSAAVDPLDSPSPDHILAGFTRTLINEHATNIIRLLNLDQVLSSHALLGSIVEELLANSDETEVALSSDHGRFVPRVRLGHALAIANYYKPSSHSTAQPGPEHDAAQENLRLGFAQPGQLRNLIWESIPRQGLEPDEVEVAVRATGLNFRDVMYTLGLLSDEAIENGFAGSTLGLEFAGKVSRIGTAVSHVTVGDRVVGFGPGCFADWVVTKGAAVSYIPRKLSYEAAATIPSTFLTSYYALCHLANLAERERVLIHGAAGGVGLAAIQIAKWRRAEIFATAGSPEKRELLKMMGVDHVLDSRSLRFADEIMAITQGEGVDVVLNSLAGEAINRNFSILRPFGRFLELGKRDFYENTRIGLKPFRNNISYFGIDADQLMNDRPDLTRRLFTEVIALFEQGLLHALPYTGFEAREVENAFRHMQQSQQIGKIVVTYRNGLPASTNESPADAKRHNLTLVPSASYLVSGGLGGFGLRTAQWLAKHGAKHLILLGRSGAASDEARKGIADMQLQGATVTALSCDVTDIIHLKQCLAPWRANIRGIVHAAAVIEDGLIRNLTGDKLSRVLAPKVLGASNLHAISHGLDLDFFVLYSSATTLFGNPGQAAYVAANSWIEGLAQWRRAQGLPATCMLWGAIEDAGFLARNTQIRDSLQQRMGGRALAADAALDELGRVLSGGQDGDQAVLEFDWQALARFLPSSGAPRFSDLAREFSGETAADQNAVFSEIVRQLDDDQLIERLVAMIRTELGQILRIAPEKLQTEKSVYDMGLDSLMAVELVVALEARFDVRLPVMALSESPTIDKLADKLKSILRAGANEDEADADKAAQATHSTHAQVLALVRQHASESTPAEIDALVRSVDQAAHNADPGGLPT